MQKQEFEYLKSELAIAISGNPLPSFKSPEALEIVRIASELSKMEDTVLLSAFGMYALSRLVDQLGRCAAGEREVALLMDRTKRK